MRLLKYANTISIPADERVVFDSPGSVLILTLFARIETRDKHPIAHLYLILLDLIAHGTPGHAGAEHPEYERVRAKRVLSSLDVYYGPIEQAFRQCTTRGDQQQLLSAFCEAFINAYDRKQTEEFSVIYAPQEVVQYQCESVEQKLRKEFGASLSNPGVPILDPCCGVGSYLIYVLGCIGREMLPYKYRRELFAIEVMPVPSFLARLNIEQAFVNLVGWYAPFPGLRYADALS